MIKSELLTLRIATAHRFVHTRTNVPPDRCFACGLRENNKIHLERYRKLQATYGSKIDQFIERGTAR